MSQATATKSCMTLNLGNYKSFLQQVQENPEKAKFSFSAKTLWNGGAATETTARNRVIRADEPEAFTAADGVNDRLLALCVGRGRAHLHVRVEITLPLKVVA